MAYACLDSETHRRDFYSKWAWRDRLHEWWWHGAPLFRRKRAKAMSP